MKRIVTVLAFALICALYFGPSVSALVSNGDFETGTFGSWTKSAFINNGLTAPPGAGGADLSAIVGGPAVPPLSLTDPRSNNNLRYPAYGNYSARVNSELSYSGGGNSQNGNSIEQTIPAYIDPSDGSAHVKFTYAAVMVNPTGNPHTDENKPYFRVRAINLSNGNAVLHDFRSFVGEAGKNWQNGAAFGGEFWQYLDWTLIDLKSTPGNPVNAGDSIQIIVTAAGCQPSGHPGYVYVDEITDNEIAGPTVMATGPATTGSGSSITYTYNYRNGSSVSINPTVTSTQPAGVTFTSVSDPVNCSLSGGTVTCNFSGVAPGATGSFTVTGNVTASTGTQLAHGNYAIAASGFPTLAGQTVFTDVTSSSTSTGVSSSANPSVFGQNVTLTANVTSGSGTPTGTVQFVVDGVNYGSPVALSGGSAQVNIANLAVGSHTVAANYSGDPGFNASTGTLSGGQTVNPAGTTVNVSTAPNPTVTGQGFTITANVVPVAPGAGTPTGTITFYVDGNPVCTGVVMASGSATCNVPGGLPAGNHTITATYSGSPSFNGNTGTQSGGATVNMADTTTAVASSANPSVSGQSVTFTATVSPVAPGSGTPTGTVTFSVNGSPVCTNAAMTGNQATCSSSSFNAGSHTVSATYNGDSNYNGSTGSLAGGQTVNPASTTTAVASSANPSVTGQSVTFTATVSPVAPGSGTPTGTVTFSINGSPVCTNAAMTAAQATCTTSAFVAGTHTVSATYNGDPNFNTSTGSLAGNQVVNAASTSTYVASSVNPSVTGQPVTFTATVSTNAPGSGTPTGTVTFSIDGSPVCVNAAMTAGQATCTSALNAGTHPVSATYNGSADYNSSTGSLAGGQVVNKADTTTAVSSSANPAVFGQSVTFTANVTANAPGAGTPTGNVTFVVDGNTLCAAAAMSGGSATCSTSSLSVGSHTVSATYNSDANFNGSTGALAGGQTVGKADTTTTVTSSMNPSTYGQSVTFTASVAPVNPGAGVPSGTLSFNFDGILLCDNVVMLSAQATCTVSNLTGGSHVVTAAYSGDGNFNTSAGSLLGGPMVVNRADSTTVITNAAQLGSPTHVDESYPVNWSVSLVAPGSGTPTGTVTVSDGSASCSAPVAAMTCALTSTTPGVKSISASYSGDGNVNGSSAAPVSHLVNVMLSGRVQQFVSGGANTDMSGVTVSLSGSATATATTDSNGRFTFSHLAGGGSYLVAPSASGFVFDPLSRNYANLNTNATNANFVGYAAPAGPRDLRVISQYLTPGDDLVLPLNLSARGNEWRMDFSLGYDPNPLKMPVAECGADAPGCSLVVDSSEMDRIGISVMFSTPPAAGDREVVKVRFRSHGSIAVSNTLITFGDSPTVRASLDTDSNPLASTYTDGAVVYARGMESDVSGRNSGDNELLANDVALLRLFVVGLLEPHPLFNEFQRADSAPALTKGDGLLDATDVVQARRFIAGLDPSVAPGGPYLRTGPATAPQQRRGEVLSGRSMNIASERFDGGRVNVPVELTGNGDEVAASFTLEYDASRLSNPRVELADGVHASLTFDASKPGRITVLLDSPDAFVAAKMTRELVLITFDPTADFASGERNTLMNFIENPTPRAISDAFGRRLDALFLSVPVNR